MAGKKRDAAKADKNTSPAATGQGEIVIYQSENGDTKIDVRFVDETVWLTQQQIGHRPIR